MSRVIEDILDEFWHLASYTLITLYTAFWAVLSVIWLTLTIPVGVVMILTRTTHSTSDKFLMFPMMMIAVLVDQFKSWME